MVDAARIENALNSIHHRWDIYYVAPTETLGSFLASRLSHISPADWPALGSFAGAYINGQISDQSTRLTAPARVEFYEPRASIAISSAEYNLLDPMNDIVFHQAGLVVCFKPRRLHTMPAREQRRFSLKASLESHFQCEVHMPSRLDFSTAGLVLASTSSATHDFAQQLFQRRRIQKWYLFASAVEKPGSQVVTAALGPDPRHPILRRVVTRGGQSAETEISYLYSHSSTCHVYLARPITGRTHQIRVHAASVGLPLLGDNFYGGALDSTLHLICAALAFPLPGQTEYQRVLAPPRLLPDWAQEARSILADRM